MNYKSISLISGTLLLSTLSANGQKKDSKPNIIFILCDDMGYGDLGCYGQPFIRTPHIDAMASEGMRFTQAYAGRVLGKFTHYHVRKQQRIFGSGTTSL